MLFGENGADEEDKSVSEAFTGVCYQIGGIMLEVCPSVQILTLTSVDCMVVLKDRLSFLMWSMITHYLGNQIYTTV